MNWMGACPRRLHRRQAQPRTTTSIQGGSRAFPSLRGTRSSKRTSQARPPGSPPGTLLAAMITWHGFHLAARRQPLFRSDKHNPVPARSMTTLPSTSGPETGPENFSEEDSPTNLKNRPSGCWARLSVFNNDEMVTTFPTHDSTHLPTAPCRPTQSLRGFSQMNRMVAVSSRPQSHSAALTAGNPPPPTATLSATNRH